MNLVLANEMAELARLNEALARFADEEGLTERDRYELALVLEELFTNIVSYAFDRPAREVIEIGVERRGDVVLVHVADPGRPFDPRSVPPANVTADVEHRQIGGLGIHLVRQLTRGLAYERHAGINHLRFHKPIRQADED